MLLFVLILVSIFICEGLCFPYERVVDNVSLPSGPGKCYTFLRRTGAGEMKMFDRTWEEMKKELGDCSQPEKECWAGLEWLHQITSNDDASLKIKMVKNEKSYAAKFDSFKIDSEEECYKLNCDRFVLGPVNGRNYALRSNLEMSNGQCFVTKDKGRRNRYFGPGWIEDNHNHNLVGGIFGLPEGESKGCAINNLDTGGWRAVDYVEMEVCIPNPPVCDSENENMDMSQTVEILQNSLDSLLTGREEDLEKDRAHIETLKSLLNEAVKRSKEDSADT